MPRNGFGFGFGFKKKLSGGGGGAPAWTPASIGVDLQGWFDAGDATTLYLESTGTPPGSTFAGDLQNAGTWRDKSGLGRHVTNGTSTSRPMRDASFTPSVLSFDGTDKLVSSTFAAVAQPYNFLVVSDNSTTSSSYFDNGTAGTRQLASRGANANTISIFAGAGLTATTAPDLGVLRAWLFEFNTTSSKIWVYDKATAQFIQVGSTGNAGSNTLAGFNLGGNASNLLQCSSMAEIVVFSGSLTSTLRGQFATYVTRWPLPLRRSRLMTVARIWVTTTPSGRDTLQNALDTNGLGDQISYDSWVANPQPDGDPMHDPSLDPPPELYWIGLSSDLSVILAVEACVDAHAAEVARHRRGPVRSRDPALTEDALLDAFPTPNSGPDPLTIVSKNAAIAAHRRDFGLGPRPDDGSPGIVAAPVK